MQLSTAHGDLSCVGQTVSKKAPQTHAAGEKLVDGLLVPGKHPKAIDVAEAVTLEDVIKAGILAGSKRLLAEKRITPSGVLKIVHDVFESASDEPLADKLVVGCPYVPDELLHGAAEDGQGEGAGAGDVALAILRHPAPGRASFAQGVAADAILCLLDPFVIHPSGRMRKIENGFVKACQISADTNADLTLRLCAPMKGTLTRLTPLAVFGAPPANKARVSDMNIWRDDT